MAVSESNPPPNIPNPDPSLATNERLANAIDLLTSRMERNREEAKGWVEALQILLEAKMEGGLKNIGTRLDGNDTALVAALKAQKEEAAKQTENFKEVLGEIKMGIAKQFDSLIAQINDLKERMSDTGGHTRGIGSMVTTVIAAASALAAVTSVVILLIKSAS